tara:strand:+ start:717 stop:2198 length:1482 start_codon:yes stop_codon:yes gene_type:complete
MLNINSKTFFIHLILFIFLFGCGSSSDITERNFDKVTQSINDCVQQSPDKGVNRYSISDSGIPLKNGEPYVFNSKDIAEEIFKISLSEGYDLGGANQICVESFVRRGENEKVDLCLRNLERMPNINYYNKDWPTTDGYYEFCYQNGNIYQRFSIRDKSMDGGFEEYWENGTLRVRKFYSDGIKLDKELRVYENGVVEFKQTDSETYEAYYENGQMSSEGNSKFDRQYFENGELESYEPVNGDYKKFYENGQLREKGTYKKSKRVGKAFAYHPNGNIRWERKYNNKSKLIDGEYLSFHSDGVESARYSILNGEMHGLAHELSGALEYQVGDIYSGMATTIYLYDIDDTYKPLHSSIKPGSSFNVYVNGRYWNNSTIHKNIKNSILTDRYAFKETNNQGKTFMKRGNKYINYYDCQDPYFRCSDGEVSGWYIMENTRRKSDADEQIKEIWVRFPISDNNITTNSFIDKYSCYDQGKLLEWTYDKELLDLIKKRCE